MGKQIPAGNYMLKVNNKTLEQGVKYVPQPCSSAFIINLKNISLIFLM